jgi:hypothetical protein
MYFACLSLGGSPAFKMKESVVVSTFQSAIHVPGGISLRDDAPPKPGNVTNTRSPARTSIKDLKLKLIPTASAAWARPRCELKKSDVSLMTPTTGKVVMTVGTTIPCLAFVEIKNP